jgi:cobaltochelatase CobN
MRIHRSASILFLALLGTLSVPAQMQKPEVVLVLHSSQTMPAALAHFRKEVGAGACNCNIVSEEELTSQMLLRARAIFLQHPSQGMLERLRPSAIFALQHGLKIATDVPEFILRGWGVEPDKQLTMTLLPYWNNGGEANSYAMLLQMYKAAGGPASLPVPAVVQMPMRGIYHPDAPRLFPNMAEYLAWYRVSKPHQGALVTVNLFYSYLKDEDTAVVDALIRELEKQGMAAAGVVGSPHSSLAALFNQPQSDPVRVMMMFTLALAKPDDVVLLKKQNIHVIGLMTTHQSQPEWEADKKGVTPDRISTSLAMPESYGATEPIMVGTTEGAAKGVPPHLEPIAERVHTAAARAARWITLAEKPNTEKKLAVIYYNNPPGKGNIGASYMNLPPSIVTVLQALKQDGYQTGASLPSEGEILKMLTSVGHNVENWEPGELDKMARFGKVVLLPVSEYEKWFAELPERFRKDINERWGQPKDAKLMAWTSPQGKKYFLIPGMQLGNVFLGPQILRASAAEYTNVQHSATLPPHHGYVAAFLYYRHVLHVDAMIQMGRHGTLEWLPGKNSGQAGWDTSEVLLGDLPNINYYIMDGDGEAVQARRRGAAVLISHLTPMLAHTGNEERFSALRENVSRWQEAHETAPALAAVYASKAITELDHLGLVRQLNLDTSKIDETMERANTFLDSVEESPMPLGLATVGQMPSDDRVHAGLKSFLHDSLQPEDLRTVEPVLDQWTTDLMQNNTVQPPSNWPSALQQKSQKSLAEAKTWLENLRLSPAQELSALSRVLRGEFLVSGPVGDPLKVPDSLPSGRNLHQGDPNLLPTHAAWELGKRMGDEMMASYRKQHGAYPDHISMILWQGETGRTQGAMEAEAMYLMGIEPQWNQRNVVDHLNVTPDNKLKYPRVNILFAASGLYRDGMADKMMMLDRASRLAASAGENALSRQNRATARALMVQGMGASEAQELAQARVFSSAPGSYGTGLSNFVEQSRDVDEAKTMTDLILSKQNYAYTEKSWGSHVDHLLQYQLKGNQVVMHSRSSSLYGAADNDDVYQAMGGLRLASEAAGAKPDLVINNLRHNGREKVESARELIAAELNARNWNPRWIQEMQKEGYAGARAMSRAAEFIYGWKATAPETVAPEVWQKMYDVYVKDEYKLGLPEFMQKANPAARQAILGRLLEVDRQGTYKFTAAEREQMLGEYARNVSANGMACDANTCGNQKLKTELQKQVQQLPSTDLSSQEKQQFRQQVKSATVPPKPSPAHLQENSNKPKAMNLPSSWKGYKITYVRMEQVLSATRRYAQGHILSFLLLGAFTLILGVLFGLLRIKLTQAEVQRIGF